MFPAKRLLLVGASVTRAAVAAALRACIVGLTRRLLQPSKGVRVQWGAYRKVPMARRLVTSLMTSRDSDCEVTIFRVVAFRNYGPASTFRVDPLSTR